MPDIWMDVDAALSEVPVNIFPLTDDTDFKTRETGVAYNAAGMDLVWNFVTTAGAMTQTAVTPTTAGDYDWAHQGDGMYSIEIPASGGASINNDTEGFGWFTGYATGVLPWRGPTIGFRAAGLNNVLIDSAYSATRGLAGTALPDAAADAAGGLPISDAGGLDLDAQIGTDIDAILTDTAEIGAAGAGLTEAGGTGDQLTGVPWNAAWDAEVQSECADALTAYDPPTRTELTTDINSILSKLLKYVQLLARSDAAIETDNATELTAINADGGSGAGNFSAQTEALEALRDHIGDGTNLTEAGGDGDHLTEAGGDGDHLTEAGGTGDQLTAVPWNAAWDAEVQSECADALTAYDPPTKTEMDTAHALLATVAKQDVIDGIVDAILVDTGTTIPGLIAALNDLSAAEVNAEVDDVISTDTQAMEGQGAPSATPTIAAALMFLYKLARNKITQTATELTVYADDGSTTDHKATISDDATTYTRGELGTGA